MALPGITAFGTPNTSDSLIVPITLFTASGSPTGYVVTEDGSTVPEVDDSRWSASPPTEIVCVGEGRHNFFPWAKNASGVSSQFEANSYGSYCYITLPPFESGTYLKFDEKAGITKIYLPDGVFWGYAEFNDNATRIYLSNGTPWGYLEFDEQTNATRIYLADETLWGYFKFGEASDVAKIYLPDGTLWGEARYNSELDQTDIYQY